MKKQEICNKKTQICRKNKVATTSRITKKIFYDEELSHEFFLTIRQTTKIRNVVTNNLSTDISLIYCWSFWLLVR